MISPRALLLGLFLPLLLVGGAAAVPPIAQPRPSTETSAPVRFDDRVLFEIRTGLASFTPAERAAAIGERLNHLAQSSDTPALRVVEFESVSEIVAAGQIVMTVSDTDAAAIGVARPLLAAHYTATISAALDSYRHARSSRSLLLGLLYASATTAALLLLLFLLRRLFPKLAGFLERQRGRLIRTIRFQSVELLKEQQILSLLHTIVRIVKLVVYLVVFDLYLTTVLGFFPQTRALARRLTGYVIEPLQLAGRAFLDFIPNLFFIAVIVAVTYVVIRTTRIVFDAIGNRSVTLPGFDAEWAATTFNILRFLIIAFAAVVIFPYLPGSESPAFKGISVFLGVLLSLGSSSAIANIVSGVILTYTRAFSLGDRVQIGETTGDIVEKSLLVTRVRTIKNVEVTIPNSMILSSHVINYSSSALSRGLILHTGVTIGYDAPWRQVHELLREAAGRTAHILADPPPFILQTSLDDFYVSYQLNAYTDQPQQMATIYSELHQNIQDSFNTAGVEIMSPHYATLRDGNPAAIPTSYLPPGYRPPVFGVRLGRGDS